MAFTPIIPRSRNASGGNNITYKNGTFRLGKFAAASAGAPTHVEILIDDDAKEVLLKPSNERFPNAHKLAHAGKTSWGNTFSSHELARRLGLPLKGQTVRFFTEWDEEQKALRFSGKTRKQDI